MFLPERMSHFRGICPNYMLRLRRIWPNCMPRLRKICRVPTSLFIMHLCTQHKLYFNFNSLWYGCYNWLVSKLNWNSKITPGRTVGLLFIFSSTWKITVVYDYHLYSTYNEPTFSFGFVSPENSRGYDITPMHVCIILISNTLYTN
jgi:hypothetical protein